MSRAVCSEQAISLADEVIGLLRSRGQVVATAESLTGGLVCAALTEIPGASDVVRGGVVAYAADVKAEVLGVAATLLAARGAVDPEVAAQMAAGVRQRLRADVGVSTTGVAGPGPAEGKPAGTVHIAVSTLGGTANRALALTGGRAEIRGKTVEAALGLLRDVLREETK